MCGTVFAFFWQLRGAKRAALRMRPIYWTGASLALVYIVGYAILLSGVVAPEVWQRFARGVGLVVWVVVWAGPPRFSIRAYDKITEDLTIRLEEALKEQTKDDGV